MPLRLESRPVGDVVVVHCNGRIVAGPEVQSLQAQMEKVMRDHREVVLQLEQVGFIDSGGLGALVRLVTSARRDGGSVRLCGVPGPVRKTLEMTNLISLFEVHDSEADAILAAYLGSHSSDSSDTQLRVLCVFDSADVRALLGEVLCRAGYKAVTAGNVNDAQILLKATKANFVVLGANMETVHGTSTKKVFEAIAPSVTVLVLDEGFAAQEPGEAASKLLEKLRDATAGNRASA